MPDRLTAGLEALDRAPVPVTWDDVEARLDAADPSDLPLAPDPPEVGGRRRARWFVVGALVVAAGLVVAVIVDAASEPVVVGPAAPTTTNPSTATTLPATGTMWHTAATAWTGTEYLVWGGQASHDGTGRADGWRYDPETGETEDIPLAPIAPRDEAAGAWTGTELIVCCGVEVGPGPDYDTASAAAYDPSEDRWRVLAPPPREAAGHTLGAVWTGAEMLVVTAIEGPGAADLLLHAYDPATDTWSRRADPLGGDRGGQLIWTGDELVVWPPGRAPGRETGQRYDPSSDTWTALPELPDDHRPWYASAAWVDGQLVVWGIDQQDDLATVGYRWQPGDVAWRPMAPAPVEVERWGEWTPGSQTFAVDISDDDLFVVSVHPGTESGDNVRPLLSYDPVGDYWSLFGEVPALGYEYSTIVVGGWLALQPDRADPVAFEVDR
jgi:hypothetical protein